MGVLLNISRGQAVAGNLRVEEPAGVHPEASAVLASEATYAPATAAGVIATGGGGSGEAAVVAEAPS